MFILGAKNHFFFFFSLLFLPLSSSPPSPSGKKKKKRPPAGAGSGAEPQVSNVFHEDHGGRKTSILYAAAAATLQRSVSRRPRTRLQRRSRTSGRRTPRQHRTSGLTLVRRRVGRCGTGGCNFRTAAASPHPPPRGIFWWHKRLSGRDTGK